METGQSTIARLESRSTNGSAEVSNSVT